MTGRGQGLPKGPQIALPLGYREALGRGDYLLGESNRIAVEWIDRWPDWPAPALVLSGPAGSGKSHLAEVWRARSGAGRIDAKALTEAAVPALLEPGALVVEDLDRLADETALFHLLNFAREEGASLLLTARAAPAQLDTALPDLASRLRALPHATLGEPDEDLLKKLIEKLFADRGLEGTGKIAEFLVTRIERSAATAREIVAQIDGFALTHSRRINLPLVREVVAARESGEI